MKKTNPEKGMTFNSNLILREKTRLNKYKNEIVKKIFRDASKYDLFVNHWKKGV